MSSHADHRDVLPLNDDLGSLIRWSFTARAGRILAPAKGRERLMAALRNQPPHLLRYRRSSHDEFCWEPPHDTGPHRSTFDGWSTLIHAKGSIRLTSF
jgi:hypothetical protein